MNPYDGTDTARDFLHEFCAAWKLLYLRGRGREFGSWTGNRETSYQHTIRCFSSVESSDGSDSAPYIRCHREAERNAGYHLLQSVLHRMLMFWEKEWSHRLDELDSAVNAKVMTNPFSITNRCLHG
jgi:hypothetical protein